MKLKSYSSEGIVLSRRNFGEADRILAVYSKHHGRVSLIAKGVRRPKSRKRGHIEPFNLIKFQVVSGKGMDIMTEAEVVDDFREVKSNLKRVTLGYYFMEVVSKITQEGESNDKFFDLIINSLTKLKKVNALKQLRFNFIKDTLIVLGYWPKDQELNFPDLALNEIVEKQLTSVRVGKLMLQ